MLTALDAFAPLSFISLSCAAAVTIGKLLYQHRRRWALSSARDEVEQDPGRQSMWRTLSGKKPKKTPFTDMVGEADSDGSSGSSSNAQPHGGQQRTHGGQSGPDVYNPRNVGLRMHN
jgi:hypothetical protein